MHPLTPIDLFQGRPAQTLLPTDHLKNAAVKALSDKSIFGPGLGYGPDEGYAPLRQNIASWLSEFYQTPQPPNADRICITGGASQNLATILQVFTDPLQTKMIWMVEPCYHLVFRTFEDAGFSGRMRGIPEDEQGMDSNALENAMERFAQEEDASDCCFSEAPARAIKPLRPWRKIYKHIIYCVPNFSNPSGTTMPVSRRGSLVRIARKFDALIICDDVYDLVSWNLDGTNSSSTSFPRLVDIDHTLDGGPLDNFGNVVSNGTFSKLIGPGCRVGWAEGTEKFAYGLSQVGQTISGGAPSQLMSTFVNELLESKLLQEHIADIVVPQGRQRYFNLVSAIEKFLAPLGVTFSPGSACTGISGGYCVWIRLPGSLRAVDVCRKAAEEQKLTLGCGDVFEVPGDNCSKKDLHHRLRLCFMWEDEGRVVEGVERLAFVISELLSIRS